ncbi:hypothetical protein EVAR_79647_1 [Eumeta japonica]|uniref:Uncharacterized protein n=1 Tax=Eumeta variegata TaxID=151549 RepID=A0A4C1W8V1_EUMVA|nr:hypothetical protein EVAR_79647_1 [Eumeta japonica]
MFERSGFSTGGDDVYTTHKAIPQNERSHTPTPLGMTAELGPDCGSRFTKGGPPSQIKSPEFAASVAIA